MHLITFAVDKTSPAEYGPEWLKASSPFYSCVFNDLAFQ